MKVKALIPILTVVALLFTGCGGAAEEEKPSGGLEGLKIESQGLGPQSGYEAPDLVLKIGEPVVTPKAVITVKEATVANTYEYLSSVTNEMAVKEASPGWTWVRIVVDIENVSPAIIKAGVRHMRCRYAELKLGPSVDAYRYAGPDGLRISLDLEPGDTMGGVVVFPIPEGSTGIRVIYEMQYLNTTYNLVAWEL